jgi:hypothetical protein
MPSKAFPAKKRFSISGDGYIQLLTDITIRTSRSYVENENCWYKYWRMRDEHHKKNPPEGSYRDKLENLFRKDEFRWAN